MSWIAIRNTLLDDPAVIQIAGELGIDEYGVVGRLVRLWTWADQHTTDGNVDSVTTAWVDRFLGTPGFAAALLHAGWLRARSAGLEIPNFTRWNTQSAKSRLTSARRVEAHRSKRKCNASGNGSGVTEPLPEKRREEKKEEPPNPPSGGGDSSPASPAKRRPNATSPPSPESVPLPFALDSPDFRAAWAEWLAERAARKKPLTPRAAALQLGKLSVLSPARAAECIRESIANSWIGLFPDKFRDVPAKTATPTRPQVLYDPPPVSPTAPLTVDFIPPKSKTQEASGATAETEPADW